MGAYAVQELGVMHSRNSTNQDITNQIFADAPYNAFYVSTSTAESYRRLYAYAASIYPLGISEAILATWYMADLRDILHGATTTPEGIAKVTQIKKALAAADADVQRVNGDPVASIDIPSIETYEGNAEVYLASVGAIDPGKVENTFQSALHFMNAVGAPSGEMTNVYYAAFLYNTYGMKRLADIKQLLAPFSTSNSDGIFPASKAALISLINPTTPGTKIQRLWMINLAQVDPDFKTYLLAIGWPGGEFVQ
jgi:hypothetical protein